MVAVGVGARIAAARAGDKMRALALLILRLSARRRS